MSSPGGRATALRSRGATGLLRLGGQRFLFAAVEQLVQPGRQHPSDQRRHDERAAHADVDQRLLAVAVGAQARPGARRRDFCPAGWAWDQLCQAVDWAIASVPDCQGPLLSRELEGGLLPVTGPVPVSPFSSGGRLVRGELMVDQQRLTPLREGPPLVTSCWMCGIRLSADHMVADGGSACDDVRWYCQDTRACTERWTARSARPAGARQAS